MRRFPAITIGGAKTAGVVTPVAPLPSARNRAHVASSVESRAGPAPPDTPRISSRDMLTASERVDHSVGGTSR